MPEEKDSGSRRRRNSQFQNKVCLQIGSTPWVWFLALYFVCLSLEFALKPFICIISPRKFPQKGATPLTHCAYSISTFHLTFHVFQSLPLTRVPRALAMLVPAPPPPGRPESAPLPACPLLPACQRWRFSLSACARAARGCACRGLPAPVCCCSTPSLHTAAAGQGCGSCAVPVLSPSCLASCRSCRCKRTQYTHSTHTVAVSASDERGVWRGEGQRCVFGSACIERPLLNKGQH